jgi:hypothetical protein
MNTYRLTVNVPVEALDTVRLALGEAGAWIMGSYTHCMFVTPGTGYFLPMEWAHPHIGTIWQIESVAEYRIETVCTEDKIPQVLAALRVAHPYEEPPIDLIKLEPILN